MIDPKNMPRPRAIAEVIRLAVYMRGVMLNTKVSLPPVSVAAGAGGQCFLLGWVRHDSFPLGKFTSDCAAGVITLTGQPLRLPIRQGRHVVRSTRLRSRSNAGMFPATERLTPDNRSGHSAIDVGIADFDFFSPDHNLVGIE